MSKGIPEELTEKLIPTALEAIMVIMETDNVAAVDAINRSVQAYALFRYQQVHGSRFFVLTPGSVNPAEIFIMEGTSDGD